MLMFEYQNVFLCVIFVFKGCLIIGSMMLTDVVRVLQGCFKGVVRVFQEHSWSVSERFKVF